MKLMQNPLVSDIMVMILIIIMLISVMDPMKVKVLQWMMQDSMHINLVIL